MDQSEKEFRERVLVSLYEQFAAGEKEIVFNAVEFAERTGHGEPPFDDIPPSKDEPSA